MPFWSIPGRFHVTGYSPDGDSIRFAPDDPAQLGRLGGFRPRINARGHVQLRIEAIDALETHYSPPSGGGVYHQPRRWAERAQELLLDFAGITGVVWDEGRNTVVSARDSTPGHILARSVEKNGRPVAFVHAGSSPFAVGEPVFLDTAYLAKSYNIIALRQGLAYPTFYTGLFRDLRDSLTAAVAQARTAGLGLWPEDRTNAGFDADSLAVITDGACLLPKLFRRLVEYMSSYGTALGFREKMQQSREPVLDLTQQNFTHLDSFIEQAEGSTRIRLTRRPEELVFDEMQNRPADSFSRLMGDAASDPAQGVASGTSPMGRGAA
ncbi:thermonuclease family protein [Roseomonas gilardii subsp. gilardii]|uniref:thermonuclease family protein n=1 Tax=Roseomonas gilardii TaxID=257708 RepID=UPI001FF712BC|nr:thermonuclease family protein [Roseomonas gilardii]UPG73923.1 thermonuclease family protein [Roseomonas gilardii subsp. gilardii]